MRSGIHVGPKVLLLFALFAGATTSKYHQQGMRTLLALYGAMCQTGDISIQNISGKAFVQGLCDGKTRCSGRIHQNATTFPRLPQTCNDDFYVVVVCENGEIRSTSLQLDDDSWGDFHIDCSHRELPESRLNADWMSNMGDILEKRFIHELRLPGSHDSGSYSIKGSMSQFAKTQSISTGQQLLGGVRYLDIRLGNFGRLLGLKGTRIIHGPFLGQLALEDLLDIWAFTTLHPKELVILDIQQTLLDAKARRLIFKWIHKLFKNVALIPNTVDIKTITMGDMWRSNKRILIFSDDPGRHTDEFLVWKRHIILNPWPDTCDVAVIRDNADRLLQDVQNQTTPHLSILQWVLTVKILCPLSLYERSLAIKKACEQYLINTGFPFNIVLLDYIQEPLFEPGLLEHIIISNKYR